jgi:hypothetical protein
MPFLQSISGFAIVNYFSNMMPFVFSENPRIQVDSYSSDQPDPTLFFL